MDRTNFTTPEREKGQHLGFEERCSIKIGDTSRKVSPSTSIQQSKFSALPMR